MEIVDHAFIFECAKKHLPECWMVIYFDSKNRLRAAYAPTNKFDFSHSNEENIYLGQFLNKELGLYYKFAFGPNTTSYQTYYVLHPSSYR